MPDDSEVHAIELPDPATIGMINTLAQIMEGVVNSIPFPFTCADLMAAHLKSAFEVALMHTPNPKEVRDNLVAGLDAILIDIAVAKGKLN